MTNLERAFRTLRRADKNRRLNSAICVVIGLAVLASGIWAQLASAKFLGDTLEQFSDSPLLAISLTAPAAATITLGFLNIFLGLGFSVYWAFRFFVPDPKTTVLLALLEQANLEQNGDVHNDLHADA